MISLQAIPPQGAHVGDPQSRKSHREHKGVDFRSGLLRFFGDIRHLVGTEWYLLRTINFDSPEMRSRILGYPYPRDRKFENTSKSLLFLRFGKYSQPNPPVLVPRPYATDTSS